MTFDHMRNEDSLDKLQIRLVTGYILNYQRKWVDTWTEWTWEPYRNKCYVISQEVKDHTDVQCRDGTQCNRSAGQTLDMSSPLSIYGLLHPCLTTCGVSAPKNAGVKWWKCEQW